MGLPTYFCRLFLNCFASSTGLVGEVTRPLATWPTETFARSGSAICDRRGWRSLGRAHEPGLLVGLFGQGGSIFLVFFSVFFFFFRIFFPCFAPPVRWGLLDFMSATPQPPAPDGSVPHRTSTAGSRWQCSFMSDRLSESMSDGMSVYVRYRRSESVRICVGENFRICVR